MPTHSNVKVCTHIKVNGVPCGSPALRGEQFCYFHQRMVRGVRTPPHSRIHPVALIEDAEAIQASLMEVINALMHNSLDVRRAELILRALHIAVRNAHRVHFDRFEHKMIKEVPEYAPHAATLDDEPDLPYSAAVPPASARESAEEHRRAVRTQQELDRRAAIRDTLLRAGQNLASGPSAPPIPQPSKAPVAATTHATTGAPGPVSPTRNPVPDNKKPPVSVKSLAKERTTRGAPGRQASAGLSG